MKNRRAAEIRPFGLAICLMCLLWGASPGRASGYLDPAFTRLCHQAIERASQQMNVPRDVMLAISLTETGKNIGGKISPWPWTVNMEGKGAWFATRAEALAYVKAHFARGARSFDVGCFQINYKWHHQHFRSIEDMFDPRINAAYAAKYLGDLYRETGSWPKAAGYYHSRTPEYYTRYAERFSRFRAKIAGGDVPVFEGHGSEALRVSDSRPQRSSLHATGPLITLSDNAAEHRAYATSGSLFSDPTQTSGLLKGATQPLF